MPSRLLSTPVGGDGLPTLDFAEWSQLAIDAIRARVTAPVSSSIPRDRPAEYVRVLRTGGTRTRLVDRPQITVETFARRESRAEALANQCRSALAALPGTTVGGVQVYKVEELAGPANLPDPTTSDSRFTQTVVIHGRIEEAP